MIKKILYLSITCLLVVSNLACAQPPENKTEPQVPINRIAAIVNDEVISETDLDDAIEQLKQQFVANKMTLPAPKKLRDNALEQLINYRLQLQMAARYDVKPTPEELAQTIEQVAKSHNMTLDQLKAELATQHIPYEDFRKKLNEQLTISKLQQQMIAGQIKVTDADVAEFKKSPIGPREYKLVDFFLPLSETPSEAELDRTLSQAHEIRKKLNSGADVSTIKASSQDLGWRSANDLPQIFAEQLPALTTQNASPPLRAPNGYHVLKLVDTRTTTANLTDDQIRQIVFRQKYEAAVKTAVDKARKEAYVDIIPQ